MKKNIVIPLALLAVIGIGVIIINACSKSDQEKVTTPGKITHFSPSEAQVVALITQFNQRYKNHKAGYKSGGDINLGEAEWTIEAAVNYEFRGIKEDVKEAVSDSVLLTAEVFVGENNEYFISETNAVELYDDMLEFTTGKVTEENQLLVADVDIKEVVNGVASIKLTTITYGNLPNPCQLYYNDYWYAAAGAGKCNGYPGGNGKDAADKINTLLNCSKLNAWWSDVDEFEIVIYWGPNYEPCFWGMEYTGNWNDCLSPQNIDYWYDWAYYVREDAKPPNKSFIDCVFKSDLLVGDGTFFHYFDEIRYGIPHEIDPEE